MTHYLKIQENNLFNIFVFYIFLFVFHFYSLKLYTKYSNILIKYLLIRTLEKKFFNQKSLGKISLNLFKTID